MTQLSHDMKRLGVPGRSVWVALLALALGVGGGLGEVHAEGPQAGVTSVRPLARAKRRAKRTRPKPKVKVRYELRFYTVRRGDTLGGIAARLKVPLRRLRRWNQLGKGELLRTGQRLKYTVRIELKRRMVRRKPAPRRAPRGEKPKPVKAKARKVVARRVVKAQDKRFPSFRIPAHKLRARSIGKPGAGYLTGAIALPRRGLGFRRIHSKRFYGTDKTIALLVYLGAKIAARFPGTRPVLIGAISNKVGGKAGRHKSHQNGLDVDIAYFEKGNPKRKHYRGRVKPHELDYVKNWYLVETLLLTGEVNYIFINRPILRGLRRQARKMGWTAKALRKVFGNPDLKGRGRILRHWPGHGYHMHVRFKCHKADKQCRHSRYY